MEYETLDVLQTLIGCLTEALDDCEATLLQASKTYSRAVGYNEHCKLTGLPPNVDTAVALEVWQQAVREYNVIKAVAYESYIMRNREFLEQIAAERMSYFFEGMTTAEETVTNIIGDLVQKVAKGG